MKRFIDRVETTPLRQWLASGVQPRQEGRSAAQDCRARSGGRTILRARDGARARHVRDAHDRHQPHSAKQAHFHRLLKDRALTFRERSDKILTEITADEWKEAARMCDAQGYWSRALPAADQEGALDGQYFEPGGAPVLLSEEPMRSSVVTNCRQQLIAEGTGERPSSAVSSDGTRGNTRWAIDEESSETIVSHLNDKHATWPRTNDAAERQKASPDWQGLPHFAGRAPAVSTAWTSYGHATATYYRGKHRANLMYEWVKAKI